MDACLLLNATYEPIEVLNWQRAITLWTLGKVEILERHDKEVRSVSFSFKLPSVVRLLEYVRIKRKRAAVPFTRANIYARDNYTCQYCAEVFASEDLTFDHVVPQAQGGTKGWENIVTCCVQCNRKKDARTPSEAQMPLLKQPRKPVTAPIFRVTVGLRRTPENWLSYLYWHAELES